MGFMIQCDKVITARRLDLLVLDKKKKSAKGLITPYHKMLEWSRAKMRSTKI